MASLYNPLVAESVSAGSGVGVLDKAVRLLDLLAAGSARSSAELAEAAGISRPTTYRLLSALEEHGLAARTETGTWGLGTRLRAWANGTNGEHALVSAGLGAVARLRDRTGESAQLYLRRGE
ncbi:MAG: transcriptional regulator, IclR family, partial [Acidimicrobiaceae bacterium]|nr:transcriptional regulator, IclR family [Acidimicrobiaceae bacterium]